MLFFLLCILVGVLAHYAAIFVTASLAASYDDFEDFVSGMLNFVYMGSAMVLVIYLFFGSASVLFTAFAIGMFFTMTRVDLEATHEIMRDIDD